MTYKGYEARVEFDESARLFHGEVLNTRDVITFKGASVDELEQAFRDSVDDYLEFCAARGEEPDQLFSGRVLVRISPQLHRELMSEARKHGKSLNAYVALLLRSRRPNAA